MSFSVVGPAGFRTRDLLQTAAQRHDIHSAVRKSLLVVRKESSCSNYSAHSTGWSESSMPTKPLKGTIGN